MAVATGEIGHGDIAICGDRGAGDAGGRAGGYGATPERDEFDTREIWDADEALCAMQEAFGLMADVIACDGFQLMDHSRAGFRLPSAPSTSTTPPDIPRRVHRILPSQHHISPLFRGAFIKKL